MPERPTRVRLTAQQKLAVHKHRAAHPDLTLSAVCAWAAMALKLLKTRSLSAMSLLLKTPTSDDAVRARPMLKTAQRVVSPELEARLVAWVRKCEQLRIPVVSWPTLRGKAEKIRAALLADPQHAGDKRLNALRFSDGWVQKLQQRHGLKPRRVSGEAASARASEVERGRAELVEVTKQYNAQDIFNMDESAFFYCTPPTSAVSTSRMPGRKISKKRITVALTTNSDGSHKVPLLFVGQAAKPRCFGGKSGAELGVDYTSSKKGWMTTSIFVAWLERFDAQMAEEGRHVLLLLDNASPHRVRHPMSNVTVHHLPPNTTAHLQPNDAGIIHAFKKQVANRRAAIVVDRLDRLLEREESGGEAASEHELEHLFGATVLEAMTWAQEVWEAVSSSAVANCWQHTGILDVDVFELLARMERLRVAPLSV